MTKPLEVLSEPVFHGYGFVATVLAARSRGRHVLGADLMSARLVDLEPHWILLPNWSPQSPGFYIGVSFLCPCPKCMTNACVTCGHKPEARRLAVNFWPPVDTAGLLGKMFDLPDSYKQAHQRTGDTFETLSLLPSVGFEKIGHWHGTINQGVLTP